MPNDSLKQQLDQAHDGLLHIHKALIDYERARYEKVHGTVASPYALLNLLIQDPWFAWLRPISSLIVQIDEFVSAKEPQDPAAGEALLKEIRNILAPNDAGTETQQKFARALKESSDISRLHATWKFAPQ